VILNLAENFKFKNLKLVFRGGCIATTVLEKLFLGTVAFQQQPPSNVFSGAVHVLEPQLKKNF
jgi:hypothetical protein